MTRPQRGVPPLKPMPQYQRPMRHWYWRQRRVYAVYLLRELTCLAVIYYAVLLLVALQRLLAGEAAFTQFMMALRSPFWVGLNLLALVALCFHALTWFSVLPKTAPFLFWRGRRVPDVWLVRGSLAAWALASIAVLVLLKVSGP